MRVLRVVLIAFGLGCLWFGGQLSGVGSAIGDTIDEFRVAHRFASSREHHKLAATLGVLDTLAESFGILSMLIGLATIGCGVFPWSRWLGPKTPRPPASQGSRGPQSLHS